MSTTVTLDDDVLERAKAESQARGVSLDEAVNEALRRVLAPPHQPAAERKPFRVKPLDMGWPPNLPPGTSLDRIGELLEALEGPWHK